jgi:hypothetical protein
MDIFSQNKLLIRMVIFLTALNLLLMSAFVFRDFFRKPQPPNQQNENRDVSTILEKKLKLTKEQVDLIKALRSAFIEKEKGLSAAIRIERDSINSVMFNKTADEELIRSLAKRVAEN